MAVDMADPLMTRPVAAAVPPAAAAAAAAVVVAATATAAAEIAAASGIVLAHLHQPDGSGLKACLGAAAVRLIDDDVEPVAAQHCPQRQVAAH
mmetsp:Transcript_2735/g.4709  ORF Transcript_2735/g.4709 Transcript_2735/m.4709 type:complete len:93 (+) Transcript_2735:856-1134(+)